MLSSRGDTWHGLDGLGDAPHAWMTTIALGLPKGIFDEWPEVDTQFSTTYIDKGLYDGYNLMARERVVGLTCTYIDAEGHVGVGLECGKSSPLKGLSYLDVGVG